MNSTTTREYRYNNDRWMYRETYTNREGRTYTDYYQQAFSSSSTEEGQSENYYQSTTEDNFNN